MSLLHKHRLQYCFSPWKLNERECAKGWCDFIAREENLPFTDYWIFILYKVPLRDVQ